MKAKYQACFFADLEDLSATPENTLAMFTNLAENKIALLPDTIHEISQQSMVPVARPRFASSKGDVEIVVGSKRIDILAQAPVFGGKTLEPIEDFADFVEKCISAILKDRNIKGIRMAFVVQTIQKEMSEADLKKGFASLFTPPKFYQKNTPFEWTFRANYRDELRFDEISEITNKILKIDRVGGKAIKDGVWKDFDRLVWDIDVNTVPENIDQRFTASSMKNFIKQVSIHVEGIDREVNEIFDVLEA